MNEEKHTCCNCCWHDAFSWVCFNGGSERAADFTDPEDTCPAWKAKLEEDKGE